MKLINQASNKFPLIVKDDMISKWQHEQNQIPKSVADKAMEKHKHSRKPDVQDDEMVEHNKFF